MKLLIIFILMIQLGEVQASLIAIMDTGTDMSHRDFVNKGWINSKEIVGTSIDKDKDGLPGDVYGWNFAENSPKFFNDQYNSLLTTEMRTYFLYQAKYDQNLLTKTSPEFIWLQSHNSDSDFFNKMLFVSNYIHGTHVAGLAVDGNDHAKIIPLKVIELNYHDEVEVKNTQIDNSPTQTIDDLKSFLSNTVQKEIDDSLTQAHFIHFHHVDLVNQSFGISSDQAMAYIKNQFLKMIKRDPSDDELNSLQFFYFNKLLKDGSQIFEAAPEALYVIAAGNDDSNNDLIPDYPANVVAKNKIVVTATLGHQCLADFSNYGGTKVDVAAPGVAISSAIPTNSYLPLSGTSQATPYVTNVLGMMKDANRLLKADDLKSILLGTVDHKDWLRNKIRSGGIVNKDRALKAAFLSRTMTLDIAITKAINSVPDVNFEKNNLNQNNRLPLFRKISEPSLLKTSN